MMRATHFSFWETCMYTTSITSGEQMVSRLDATLFFSRHPGHDREILRRSPLSFLLLLGCVINNVAAAEQRHRRDGILPKM